MSGNPVPMRVEELAHAWGSASSNLEDVLLPYDFFRRDRQYDSARPLILTKDGGLLALFKMDGVDPEPLGEDGLAAVSNGMRRAIEVFNGGSLDGDFADGAWEIQNVFTRGQGNAPVIPPPERDSEQLRYLTADGNAYWQARYVFEDEVCWAVKFVPRNRDRWSLFRLVSSGIWSLLRGQTDPLMKLREAQVQADFVRRVLEVFEDNVHSVRTRRPRMDLGLRWLSEEESYEMIWRQVNRRRDQPPPLRRDVPLLTQIAGSYRDNSGAHYAIDGRPTRLLTWKLPPEVSVAYLFAGLQSELRFPFTVVQNFTSLDFGRLSRGVFGLAMRERMAGALQNRHREGEFVQEASSLNHAFSAREK